MLLIINCCVNQKINIPGSFAWFLKYNFTLIYFWKKKKESNNSIMRDSSLVLGNYEGTWSRQHPKSLKTPVAKACLSKLGEP